MTKIKVVGYRYHDIIIYVAQVLAALGDKVYIKDLSSKWDMYHYIPKVSGIQPGYPLEIRGVTYGFGRQKAPEDTDYLIILCDPEQCLDEMRDDSWDVDYLVISTDEDPVHECAVERVFGYSSFDESFVGNTTIIFRDYSNINPSFCENTRDSFKQAHFFEMPFNKKDREAEVFLWVRDDPVFRSLSERMSSIVEKVVCRFRPQTSVDEFEQAYKVVFVPTRLWKT